MRRPQLAGLLALSIFCACGARARRFIGYRLTGEAPAAVACANDGQARSCPALHAQSPYHADPDVDKFPRGPEGREALSSRLADEDAWRSENPFSLLAKTSAIPAFWIEADSDDEFGFMKGAKALTQAL